MDMGIPMSPSVMPWELVNGNFPSPTENHSLAIIDCTSIQEESGPELCSKIEDLQNKVTSVVLFHSDETKNRSDLKILESLERDANVVFDVDELACLLTTFDLKGFGTWSHFPYLEEQELSEKTCANFMFKSLEEANALCQIISSQCPDPQLTSIGLLELMINAVEHGNLEISYEEKSALLKEGNWQKEVQRRLKMPQYQDRIVLLSFVRKPHRIEITITDEGNGFNSEKYLNPGQNSGSKSDGDQYHGRGIAVASQLDFEKIEYFGVGNKVKVSILTS